MTMLARLAGGLLLVAVLGGCGQPHEVDVGGVATAFYAGHAAEDGAAACARLAPQTREELEKSAEKPCPDAVLEEDVPEVSDPVRVRVFGTQAKVDWNGETTFLARFPTGWKVMAAVCEPQPGQPYDCQLSGG